VKIAQIAPLYESVPPKYYGGTERVVAHLCDALVELGHDVTLFAAADAATRARLIAVRDQAIRLDSAPLKSDLAAHLSMLHEVHRRIADFDMLHFHIDLLHFPHFERHAAKTVTTVHGRLDLKDLQGAYARWSRFGLVSISNAQRKPLPDLNWVETVLHGVPAHLYSYQPVARPGYLAFLGRISPEKRPDVAIRLADRAGRSLRIAAKVDQADRVYYAEKIAPLLRSPNVDYLGEIGDADKAEFLGNARALLFPIDWPEPFGLVMIESMACGTPVIAWDCGSVSEIVEHGVNGFVVRNEEEALDAIERVDELDRAVVRASFERRFTSTEMARAYLKVYSRLLKTATNVRTADSRLW
jgi:glycosyltransferase involved in cell wall biosynthesis